ncbi:MAG: LysE family translocator [Desulfobacteraceae bacterium]|jgi:RhtB (resistance to homoserine/threonine) family protein
MTEAQMFLFFITSLFVIITPGQDMFLVMSRSIAQGRKAGIATAAGVSTGLLGHTVLAVLGLGALLKTSEILFTAVKLIGAAYLLWLGFRLISAKREIPEFCETENSSLSKLFFQGVFSNISNPKIAIFYFSFLPQFIAPDNSSPTYCLLILGIIFAVLTFFIKAPIGYAAGSLAHKLRSCPSIQLWINRFSGIVLISLGVKLALEKKT